MFTRLQGATGDNPSMWSSYTAASIPTSATNNYQSTRDTIQLMRQLVMESLATPQIALAAKGIAQNLKYTPGTNAAGGNAKVEDICREVFWFCKKTLNLVEDEDTLVGKLGYSLPELLATHGKELLLSPAFILQQAALENGKLQGDCDDYSMLCACLLLRLGVPKGNVFFCTIAADESSPQEFTHVYTSVKLSDGSRSEMILDCSHGMYPGWETNQIYRKMYWQV